MYIEIRMLIITILILLALWYYVNYKQNVEHFQWDPLWLGNTALDCYELDENSCLNYSNCGIYQKGSNKMCVPGDEQGPFFKEDAERWTHANNSRYPFGEIVTLSSKPWNTFYPDYEARLVSPKSRATLT